MRLAEWSTYPIHLPYPRHIQWGSTDEHGADFLLLRLTADDGTVGLAEGVAKTAWHSVTLRSLAVAIEELFIPLIRDVDLLDEATVTRALGKIREHRLARAMIDIACWDMRSQARGAPMWQIWGGDPDVAVSWTVTRQRPELMAAEAATMVQRHGFGTLKVKGGQGRDTDRAALRAIRAAVGPTIEMYVDANSAYPEVEASAYLEDLAELGVTLAEDPCRLLPNRAFERLQRESPIPILVDNGCRSIQDAALFIERGARAVSVKLNGTGASDGMRLAQFAEEHGCAAHVGFMGESSLGAMVALQLASALPGRQRNLPAETSFFLTFGEEYVTERVRIAGGRARLLAEPGLARWVDWERVRAFEARPSSVDGGPQHAV